MVTALAACSCAETRVSATMLNFLCLPVPISRRSQYRGKFGWVKDSSGHLEHPCISGTALTAWRQARPHDIGAMWLQVGPG